jgi:hypothetical protein
MKSKYYSLVAVIPASQEAKIKRIMDQGQPRQKIRKTPNSANKLGVVVYVYNATYTGGISRRISVPGWPGTKKQDLS